MICLIKSIIKNMFPNATILRPQVGPDQQYIQIVDIAGNIACSLVTAESSLGARLASSLEWSARTSPLRISRPPAMLPLDCRHLAAAVARQRLERRVCIFTMFTNMHAFLSYYINTVYKMKKC